ncbi:MAG: AAA family ATPase [Bacteroidaceae bacterium]|nr:AAA family ATPase [Bacteroidaceae bacterium]
MIAIDQEKLQKLVEEYKADFKENIPLELYKWEAAKHFQDNWNIDAEDFPAMLSRSLSKTANLLASMSNFPRKMIEKYATLYTEEIKELFSILFDESLDLKERIDTFIAGIEQVHKKWDVKGGRNHYQTFNVVSTYLWLRYPNKYYIYKPSVAKILFDKLGIEIKLTPLKANAVIKTYELYDSISNHLLEDQELKAMFEEVITPSCYPDSLMRTATVDLGYYLKKKKATTVTSSKATEKKYWMYAPGENASKWERCLKQNIICIGWDSLGDLSEINSLEGCKDELKDRYNNPDSSFMNDGLAVWEFSHVMQPGDVVYAKQGLSCIIGRGIVKSDYIYDSSQENYRHTRKIEWTHIGKWELGNIVQKTLTDITKYPDYVKKIEAMIVEGKTEEAKEGMYNDKYAAYIKLLLNNSNLILNGAPGTGKTYLAKQVAAQMIYEGNVPEGFEEDTKFVEQCGFVQFHPSYDYTDFVEGLRPKNDNGNIGFERKDGTFKEFCAIALQNLLDSKKTVQTLQNELSVRDLLEGFIEESMENETMFETSGTKNAFYIIDNKEKSIIVRIPANEKTSEVSLPKSDLTTLLENKVDIKGGGDIQTYFGRKYRTQPDSYIYVLYNALTKKAVPLTKTKSVVPVPEKKFVFIIDEINRGEISKIFGELFFSIDPGYRGKKGKVQTQYQNLITEDDPFKDGFYIPENVYIIGTMNDIDRSVECMDFAMRRRFTFKEITAEESALNMELGAEATERMMSLNNAISEIEGFNSSFHIGAAYFKGVDDFDALWELKLAGLLKEYLRGMPDAEESLDALKKAYDLNEE